jgi:hypothetical protein
MGMQLYTISVGVVVSLSCFYSICNSVLCMDCDVEELVLVSFVSADLASGNLCLSMMI